MNIASSVIKFTSADGVNTFVRPKLSTSPISPIQGVKMVEGFKEKMPSQELMLQGNLIPHVQYEPLE